MKHYSREEWQSFYRGKVGEKEALMEIHLLECDVCNRLFLDCIDDVAIEQAEKMIPASFTENTLQYIRRNGQSVQQPKLLFQTRRLFLCYAAAAALTIMLTGGGVIQSLSGKMMIPPAGSTVQPLIKYEAIIFNWPTQLWEKSSNLIDSIQSYNYREVVR